jgi:flagellar biosynthesis component FlhA
MLRERVPIRDGVGILEALGEAAQSSKNPVLLTEYVRQAIRRGIVKQVVNGQGELSAYLLDPSVERAIESSVEHGEMNSILGMAPDGIRDILGRLARKIAKAESAVVVTSAGARYFLRQILEPTMPGVTVLSHNELPSDVTMRSRGVIE